VAAQIAYQYPERCERLVLVASGGIAPEVNPFLRIAAAPFAELAIAPMQWQISRRGGTLLLNLLAALGTDLGRDATELQAVFDGLPDGSSRGAFTRTLRSVVDWRGQVVTMLDRCYLAEAVPIQLFWGTHDAIIPVQHAHLAQAAMPGSRLSAGHFPHHTDPDRFVRELREFIDTTEPASHHPDRWRELLRGESPAVAAVPEAQ
jgi:pimeloyl-ACP methyl ester carboxylesterase